MSEPAPKQTTFDLKEPPRFISVTGTKDGLTAVDTFGRIWRTRSNGTEWRTWNWKTKHHAIIWELCDTWTAASKGGDIERYED